MVTQSLSRIPVAARQVNKSSVEDLVRTAIDEISSTYNWDWREVSTSLSLTDGTATYSMPADCDMISGREGVFLDSNSNPTKGRIVYMDEYTFNQRFVETNTDGSSESESTPEYFVPLVDRDSQGSIQVRFYPCPDASYTAKMYYYTEPSQNDVEHQLSSMVRNLVYSMMPQEWVGDPTYYAQMYYNLVSQMKPQERKSESSAPLFTPDERTVLTNRLMANMQDRR